MSEGEFESEETQAELELCVTVASNADEEKGRGRRGRVKERTELLTRRDHTPLTKISRLGLKTER